MPPVRTPPVKRRGNYVSDSSREASECYTPGTFQHYVAEGIKCRKASNFSTAIDHYSKATDIKPGDAGAREGKACSLMALHRYQEALVELDILQTCPDRWARATLLRTRCHLFMGEIDQAEAVSRSINPESTSSAHILSLVPIIVRVKNLMDRYWTERKSGRWSQALEVLDLVFNERQGSDAPYWQTLSASTLLGTGQLKPALEHCRKAAAVLPPAGDALFFLGLCQYLSNLAEEAANTINLLLQSFPTHGPGLKLQHRVLLTAESRWNADAAFKGKRYEDAFEHIDQALSCIGNETAEAQGGDVRTAVSVARANMLIDLVNPALNGKRVYRNLRHDQLLDLAWECVEHNRQNGPDPLAKLQIRATIMLRRHVYDQATHLYEQLSEDPRVTPQDAEHYMRQTSHCRYMHNEDTRRREASSRKPAPKSEFEVHCATLGVNVHSTEAQIRKAYQAAIMRHHPDKGGKAEDFRRVHDAFQRLKSLMDTGRS